RGGTRARKIGIVALARKLLIELWRFLELGVVPEGASPKTAERDFRPGRGEGPPRTWGALPHEFAEIRRSANTGWGDRPTCSARIEGRPRPFGPDECRGKLPGARHSAAVRGVSLETGA